MNSLLIYSLSGLFLLLVIATAILYVLQQRHPQRDWLELQQRVKTWWIIVIVFTLAVASPRLVSLVIFAIISCLALKEYLQLIPLRESDHLPVLWAYLAIPLQYFWIGIEWYGMFAIFIPVYVFLFLPMRLMLIGNNQGFLYSAATLHWGVMTTVYALSHVAYLTVLPGNHLGQGPLLVIFLVVLTECNDIAQYLWGKRFGKTKVIPKVSPNKTLEGLIGGVATTIVLAWLLGGILTPLNAWQSVIAGTIIGLSGFIGDVVMSAVKRDIGVKDSGDLLPGHGGILDRLDSLIYTAPLFFHFLRYLYY